MLPLIAVLWAAVFAVLQTPSGFADRRTAVADISLIGKSDAVTAFLHAGIPLRLTVSGSITELIGYPSQSRHFGVLVEIHRSVILAKQAFERNWQHWHAEGLVVRQLRNAIVLVDVGQSNNLFRALPRQVAAALTRLKRHAPA
jgi:hypothetical protein